MILTIDDKLWVDASTIVAAGRDFRRMQIMTNGGGVFEWEFATEAEAVSAMTLLKNAKDGK